MRLICVFLIALLLQPPAPLAVSAYVARGQLVVTVYADAPTSAQVRVSLPPGWSADEPLVRNVKVSSPVVLTWRVHGPGLALIRVVVQDGRGNTVGAVAYAQGAIKTAAAPQGIWRRRLAIIRR